MSSQNITIEDNSVSIILSTYNEAPVIEDTLKKIFETIKGVEIVLVDDNSTDGTLEKVKNFKEFNIKIFSRKERGLASAFLLGLINTTGEKIGWIDSNMGDLIKFFPAMIKDLDDNDIILLSRYVEHGSDNRSKLRVISSKLINFFCRIVLSDKIKDYTNLDYIKKEVDDSKSLFKKNNWPIIDVTRRSVEETAASILKIIEIKRNK